jgi:DNA-binding MarR family transcriptional regulator
MLPPKLAALWNEIEEARSLTLGMAHELSDGEFLLRPGNGEWSAADILEHLLIAETGTSKVIRKMIKEKGALLSPYPDDDSVLTVRPLRISREKVDRAPEAALPKGGVGKKELFEQAAECRARTRISLEMLSRFDPRGAEFPHAIFGPLNLYEWPCVLVLGHEKGHHGQLAEILRGLRRG